MILQNIIIGMLKGLKDKKSGKPDPKKQNKKEKQPKEEAKKKQQQEEEDEETNDALVDINYEEKEKNIPKNTKKVQAYKLEEKEIDISNIKIEKKEEKKQITSWVVNESEISNVFKKDFDATKHETEFESLTDAKLNKELEEKAKKEAAEKKDQIEEVGGLKFAPLAPTVGPTSAKVDVNEINVRKPAVDVNANPTTSLPISVPKEYNFINSKLNNFSNIEKTPQQLREEEIEKKMQERGGDLTLKGQGGSWIGGKKTEEPNVEPMKLSGWGVKAMQEGDISAPVRFANLEPTQNRRAERVQQEFVFTNKKEVEERRRKREEEAAKLAISKQ